MVMKNVGIYGPNSTGNTNYNLIMPSIIFLPFFLCELY